MGAMRRIAGASSMIRRHKKSGASIKVHQLQSLKSKELQAAASNNLIDALHRHALIIASNAAILVFSRSVLSVIVSLVPGLLTKHAL